MAKININTATLEQLQTLPGIGPSTAKGIKEHIKTHGELQKLADLAAIKGISPDLLKNIAEQIELEPSKRDKKRPANGKKGTQKIEFKGTTGRSKVKLRFVSNSKKPVNIRFANTNLLGKQAIPLSALKLTRLPNVHANNQNLINFSIPLSRFTPPGTHSLDVLVDGSSHSIKVDVEERVFVSLSPTRLYIEANPGTVVDKEVFVKNMGNYPITFGDPGPVILETDFIECRTIRHVVRQMDKEKASLDQLIGLAVEKLEEVYDEGSTMKIKTNGSPITIEAGTTAKIGLNIVVPKTLKRPNRYRGTFPFYNTALSFTIVPTKN